MPSAWKRRREKITTADARRYRRRTHIPLPIMVALVLIFIPLIMAASGRIYRHFIIPRISVPLIILYSDANPRVQENPKGPWTPVSGRFTLYPGDRLASGNSRRMVISVDDLHSIRLSPQTVIEIIRTRRAADGTLAVRLVLVRGRIWFDSTEERKVEWVVDTPQARILASNSVSEISLDYHGFLNVRVWRGAVEIIPLIDAESRVFVVQGQEASLAANGGIRSPRRVEAALLTPWEAWNLKTSLDDARADKVPTLSEAYFAAGREVQHQGRRLTSLYYRVDGLSPLQGDPSNVLVGVQDRSDRDGKKDASELAALPPSGTTDTALKPGLPLNQPGRGESPGQYSGSESGKPDSAVSPGDSEDVYRRAAGSQASGSGTDPTQDSPGGNSPPDGSPGNPGPEPMGTPTRHSGPPGYGVASRPIGLGNESTAAEVPGYRIGSRQVGPAQIPDRASEPTSPPGLAPGSSSQSARTGNMTWEDPGCNRRWSEGDTNTPRVMIREVGYNRLTVACDVTNQGQEAARKVRIIVTRVIGGETETDTYMVGDLAPGKVVPINFKPAPEGIEGVRQVSVKVEYDNP